MNLFLCPQGQLCLPLVFQNSYASSWTAIRSLRISCWYKTREKNSWTRCQITVAQCWYLLSRVLITNLFPFFIPWGKMHLRAASIHNFQYSHYRSYSLKNFLIMSASWQIHLSPRLTVTRHLAAVSNVIFGKKAACVAERGDVKFRDTAGLR